MQSAVPAHPELWGGVECTVNRVGDRYFDQLERTGHAHRLSDLDLFAALGLRRLRYPLLWERIAPQGLNSADWTWADRRLRRLRELGIQPIAGLVHHGSGPAGTDLLDPAFPKKLAAYAEAVARRYPWVTDYTPVNEPLTTARFSGLYGHWYPHGRSDRDFLRALINQCCGIVQAMRAIRGVNPESRLIQTEDSARTYSTPALRYQADFENERRWLSMDLLHGRVTPRHALWNYLMWAGADRGQLAWLADHPCPPDVIGLNYYLTSERFLDERLSLYPPHTHGGNGHDRYADVEAVRVRPEGISGVENLIWEAYDRYQSTIALTEVHLACADEMECVRWLVEVWRAASLAADEGAPVEAVTVWSLLGAYDWDSLVTRDAGHYEAGVFDVRTGTPSPKALAGYVTALAAGREQNAGGILSEAGWWRRPERLEYPAFAASGMAAARNGSNEAVSRPRGPRETETHLKSQEREKIMAGRP